MEKPIRVHKYGHDCWETQAMDTLRKEHCMCLFCERLKPNQSDNCEIAQFLFDNVCKKYGNAFIMTRCPIWVEKE